MFVLHRLRCRPEFCNALTVCHNTLLLHWASCAQCSKNEWNYVMRCREQSQKSTSIARSCLDSSVSLFRHSMKSLRPPCGPSSQMKAQSLGKRSSRCVRPAENQRMHSDILQDVTVCLYNKEICKILVLTGEYLESYLR